jgi:chaperonin GroES
MIHPAGHRVLVKPDPIEEKTASGIVVSVGTTKDREQQAQIFGVITAIGPNAWKGFDDGTPWANVGDKVAIAKYGGFIIRDPDTREEFRLLNDEDICAIIRSQ